MIRTERRQAEQKRRARLLALISALILLLALAFLGCTSHGPGTPPPEPTYCEETGFPDAPAAFRPAQEAGAAEVLAKMVWGEARGCPPTEQAATVWCVLNRVDSEDPYYPDTIAGVVTQPSQFVGYDASNPVDPAILALVEDVLARWSIEDICTGDVDRVLPEAYLFFTGDGKINTFTTDWKGGEVWDWSLDSPYEED